MADKVPDPRQGQASVELQQDTELLGHVSGFHGQEGAVGGARAVDAGPRPNAGRPVRR